jgi:hypothetical protein
MHGYGIAQHLRQLSDEILQVGESSLYPAFNASSFMAGRVPSGAHLKTTVERGSTR